MTDTIADPWVSGAFDHPVSHSPLPWASAHTSPRSSLSSYTREMSVYSHEGSEQAYPGVKAEYATWTSGVQWGETADTVEMHGLTSSRTSSLTVAPERLNSAAFPYGHSYAAVSVTKVESSPMYDQYDEQEFERASSEESNLRSKPRTNFSAAGVSRERGHNRRHTDPANAQYICEICKDKGFARRYNYKQHMLTHEANRKKEHICPYSDCRRPFVRKTDLERHDRSVHQKVKPFQCSRCPNRFPRKDTLRR
jgi:hypothetical protein